MQVRLDIKLLALDAGSQAELGQGGAHIGNLHPALEAALVAAVVIKDAIIVMRLFWAAPLHHGVRDYADALGVRLQAANHRLVALHSILEGPAAQVLLPHDEGVRGKVQVADGEGVEAP